MNNMSFSPIKVGRKREFSYTVLINVRLKMNEKTGNLTLRKKVMTGCYINITS